MDSRLSIFYAAIRDDHRIGPIHISLYMAIFQLYEMNGCNNPVRSRRTMIMRLAKIGGLPTFHKYIKELQEFHYLQYLPSYDHRIESSLVLLKVSNKIID